MRSMCDEEEAYKLLKACSVIAVVLLIFVFDVIGLCQGWNPAVFAACGHDLPNFVIACLVVLFAIWLLCWFLHCLNTSDWSCPACVVLIMSVVMCCLGFIFSEQANTNPYCIGNLTETGFVKTTTPVLVVMGYMHAAVFIVVALISLAQCIVVTPV